MNIMNVGDGKVVLIAGGDKVYTDIASRFVGSERDLDDILASPYDKRIVENILSSGHLAATEFDYFLFGIEGYSRVTEVQLVRKRLASYLIKSGRPNKGGKRSFDVVLPYSTRNVETFVPLHEGDIYIKKEGEHFPIELFNSDAYNHLYMKVDCFSLLEWTEQWYDAGVKAGFKEEELRYLKPQATEFKAIIGMNCYSEDTEVLTNEGWKFFKDLHGEELFYSINPDTQIVELIPAINFIKKSHDGEMIAVNTKNISLLTTPEHNNLVAYDWKKEDRKFILDKAENMIGHKNVSMMKSCNFVKGGVLQEYFIFKELDNSKLHFNGKHYDKTIVSMNEMLQLIGFYLADGNCFHNGVNETTKCGITLSKGDKSILLHYKDLIDNWFGIDSKIYDNKHGCFKLNVYSPQLYSFFKEFGTALEKYIPEFVWDLPKEQLNYLYDGLLDGDCNKRGTSVTFSTSSKQLADDIQRLLLHLGLSGTINTVDKIGKVSSGIDSNGNSYCIETKNLNHTISVCREKNTPFIVQYNDTGKVITKEYYKGNVYCVTLPENHTLYVRREGKPVWSGNCHALIDWFKIRCCKNAQTEIRDLANKMLRLCKQASPDLFREAGASCVALGYCPENKRQHKDCKGNRLTHNEVKELINNARN